MTTVIVADDNPLTLIGTAAFLEKCGCKVLDTCGNGIAAYQGILLKRPMLAVLDIDMPGMSGLDVLARIHAEKMETKVVLLTIHKEYSIYKKALEYAVGGYIIKERAAEELDACIKAVLRGENYLSREVRDQLVLDPSAVEDRELESLTLMERKVLDLILEQRTSRQIAEVFFVSEKMIEKHRASIIEKLNLPKEKNILLKWASLRRRPR